jgi:hypothetical protein
MLKSSQGAFALISLVLFAFWIFVALPLLYAPHGETPNEIFGVKYGEWLMFAATIALWVATMGLWWATSRLVKGAEKTAERQLRAYVMVESIKYRSVSDVPTPHNAVAEIVLKNYGQTPAQELSVLLGVDLGDRKAGLSLKLDESQRSGKTAMAPNSVITFAEPLGHPIFDSRMGDIIAGKLFIYVYGEIVYLDVFGEARKTDFRFACGGPVANHENVRHLSRR